MTTFLLLILVVIYFCVGVSALAWFFDWGTEPLRSPLWVGPWMFALLFLIGSTMLMATWAVQGR